MIVCTVNGRAFELDADETVAQMLERLGIPGSYALVERNGEPVDRTNYE